MHLVFHVLGVCIVNRWLLYRRHCHQNGTCIQYTMHVKYALLIDGCCIEDCHQNGTCIQYSMHLEYALLIGGCCMVAVQKTLPSKWYMHLVYYALGVCLVNGWWLYRRHRQQNGTHIWYTMHLEYALLMGGCCIEGTVIKIVHAFSILYTWSMHC